MISSFEDQDPDNDMEGIEVLFIVPDGIEWNGISNYIKGFSAPSDMPSKGVFITDKRDLGSFDNGVYIRYDDKKIERGRLF